MKATDDSTCNIILEKSTKTKTKKKAEEVNITDVLQYWNEKMNEKWLALNKDYTLLTSRWEITGKVQLVKYQSILVLFTLILGKFTLK